MNESITVSAEQVEQLRSMLELTNKRVERTNKDSETRRIFEAEGLTIERVLDILGIEY